MNAKGLYRYLGTLAGLVERQARAVGTHCQEQSSFSRGSSFDDFKKLGSSYFFGTSDLIEAKAWILKMEKFFDVIDCYEERKPSYAIICVRQKGKSLMAYDSGLVWDQIYRVVMFCSIIDCYKRGKMH